MWGACSAAALSPLSACSVPFTTSSGLLTRRPTHRVPSPAFTADNCAVRRVETYTACPMCCSASTLTARAFSSSSTLWKSLKTAAETQAPPEETSRVAEEGGAAAAPAKPDTSTEGGSAMKAETAKESENETSPSPTAKEAGEVKEDKPKNKLPEEEEQTLSAETEKASKREEVANETGTEPVSTGDVSTPEARRKQERLLDAEKSLLIEEVFAQDNYQQFIHTTEVSTTEGLRWLDVSASPEFFEDPLLAHVAEGQFAYSVMRKLFGSRFPIGVYASVASGAALPATYVDENWACLILRSTKEAVPQEDDVGGPPHTAGNNSSAGGADTHGRRGRHRWSLSSLSRRWHDSNPSDYDIDNAAMKHRKSDDAYVYDEATNDYYPRRVKASQQWAQHLERRLHRRRLAKRAAAAGFTRSGTASKTASTASQATAALLRHRAASPASSYRSPLTMTDFTDRLTVFIGKELHPVEKDPDDPVTAAATRAASEALVLSLDVDRACAEKPPGGGGQQRSRDAPPHRTNNTENDSKSTVSAAAADGKAAESKDGAAAQPTHYEVRWRVITVHRSPLTFIRDMQSQWNKLTSRGGRLVRTMRSVPAHAHGPLDGEEAIKLALRRAARPASMVEEEDEEEGSGSSSSSHDDVHNTMVDRVTGWEDLVRLLYHGAARTLQESAYRNTRRLEVMETEIFDASDNSAQHLHAMTRLMAELHLLSREATIHNAILRESKVAYQKLKRVLDHPVDLADQRELLYVDSVLSISAHLEEQSESLLFLQFSVAMNQTEQHLRTLTIFNTLFIPLDFICTCFGSDIFSSPALSHNQTAMYGVFGLMATTAVVTLRWIRRNLR